MRREFSGDWDLFTTYKIFDGSTVFLEIKDLSDFLEKEKIT